MTKDFVARFPRLLGEQLDFIDTSARRWDAGHRHEAKRIALAVRILFHDKKRNVSLLTHLDAENISMLSLSGSNPAALSKHSLASLGIGFVRSDGNGNRLIPRCLHPERTAKQVQRSVWWNEVIAIVSRDAPWTRCAIALSTVERDGGAHVDALLEQKYKRLATGEFGPWLQFAHTSSGENPLKSAHYVALRDMAYEILNSPELTALAIAPA